MNEAKKLNWFQRTVRRLADVKDAEQKSMKIVHVGDQGSTGTKSYSGYPHEEYLAALRGYRRADIYDSMRRSDTTVIMLLSAIKNLIRSCVWNFEPGEQSEEAKADAELIEHIFRNMMDPWDQYVNEALTAIDFGNAVFERTHKIVQNDSKFGSYVGLKSMSWRSPKTIDRWNLDPLTGKLISVTQIAYGDLDRYVDMDAKYLSVISINREGSNYEGISMLRPLYGSFLRKKTYLKLNAIGIEKFAIPTPIAEVPESATGEGDKQFDNLIEALENFVAHEKQYLTYPTGWKVNLVPNTYDPQKVEVSIDNEDKRMVNGFLANFLNLGQGGSGGSYALSNDLSDFFLAGLDYIANLIVEDLNRNVIPELIQMNRGPRLVYPKITHSGISDKAGKEFAEVIDILTRSKAIIPDKPMEDFLREKYKLTKASDEGQRMVQNTQPSPQSLFNETNHIYKRIKAAEAKRLK